MPFNSYAFLFLFLPILLAAYYGAALTRARALRLPVLILATLIFYATAAARWLPLLLGSMLFNYACARIIGASSGRRRALLLTTGVAANVALLVGIKYSGFLAANIDALTGLALPVPAVALPLALSFYSFQQIAFLVDTARGTVRPARPLGYAGSILFFPIIISGPITLYRELHSQLEAPPPARDVPGHLLVGLTLFAIGLFKKTVLADSLILWVDPLFGQVAAGAHLGWGAAWGLALGFLLQMYFDFSGYSDMAVGLARMLGIRLPLNFFSPMRCTSVVEWWRRWHMTLGRFVNEYIYQPIALAAMRRAAARGLGKRGRFVAGTLAPTFVAMLVIGAWHGGNWTFVVFGLLHGSFMVIAESWRFVRRKARKGRVERWWHRASGNLLTIGAVLVAVVPFRAPEMAAATRLWRGMVGLNGWRAGVAAWPALAPTGGWGFAGLIALGLAIVYLLPNSAQIMAKAEPVLEWPRWRTTSPPVLRFAWVPTVGWSMLAGAVLLVAAAFISRGASSFVYFGY